jgi:hypothetical protein
VLTSFTFGNGGWPYGSLIIDTAGNPYGTARVGATPYGNMFKLSPPAAGKTQWAETVLFDFHFHDGSTPLGSLVSDAAAHHEGF